MHWEKVRKLTNATMTRGEQGWRVAKIPDSWAQAGTGGGQRGLDATRC